MREITNIILGESTMLYEGESIERGKKGSGILSGGAFLYRVRLSDRSMSETSRGELCDNLAPSSATLGDM